MVRSMLKWNQVMCTLIVFVFLFTHTYQRMYRRPRVVVSDSSDDNNNIEM